MEQRRLFIFGYGYTSSALVKRLRAEAAWSVVATTRSAEKAAAMARQDITPVILNGGSGADAPDGNETDGNEIDWNVLDGASHILISAPPGDAGCPALAAVGDAVAQRADAIGWIGYLSTNGVYGDHDGAWVDETSQLRGTSARARARIDAEQAWRAFSQTTAIPLVLFRLPGIYGPGRSAIDTVRAGAARRIFKAGQVFSRMHVDDIASAVAASMARPAAGALFNLADDEPAPPQDVIAYACHLLNVTPPPLTPIDEAALSPMAKSFYADNKRVSNARMKAALGIALRYPTYREGLDSIYRSRFER